MTGTPSRFIPLKAVEERGPDQITVVAEVAIFDRCFAGEPLALEADFGADADRKREADAQASTAYVFQEPGKIHDLALLVAVFNPDKFRAQRSLCDAAVLGLFRHEQVLSQTANHIDQF